MPPSPRLMGVPSPDKANTKNEIIRSKSRVYFFCFKKVKTISSLIKKIKNNRFWIERFGSRERNTNINSIMLESAQAKAAFRKSFLK